MFQIDAETYRKLLLEIDEITTRIAEAQAVVEFKTIDPASFVADCEQTVREGVVGCVAVDAVDERSEPLPHALGQHQRAVELAVLV